MQIAGIIMRKFDELIEQILSFSADIISTHSDGCKGPCLLSKRP